MIEMALRLVRHEMGDRLKHTGCVEMALGAFDAATEEALGVAMDLCGARADSGREHHHIHVCDRFAGHEGLCDCYCNAVFDPTEEEG